MGWEMRGQHRCFYRVYRRPDGRVAREYCGSGDKAEKAAAALDHARGEAQKAQTRLAQLEREQAGRDAQVATLDQAIRALLGAELLLAGCYQHAGVWRRKREKQT